MCSFFDDPVVNRNKQSLAHRQKEKKLDAYMSENVFFSRYYIQTQFHFNHVNVNYTISIQIREN